MASRGPGPGGATHSPFVVVFPNQIEVEVVEVCAQALEIVDDEDRGAGHGDQDRSASTFGLRALRVREGNVLRVRDVNKLDSRKQMNRLVAQKIGREQTRQSLPILPLLVGVTLRDQFLEGQATG